MIGIFGIWAGLLAGGAALAAASEGLSPEYVELLQDLVRTPSVNGEAPEAAVVQVLADFARAHGCEPELTAVDPSRPILTVTVGPRDRAGLLIVGHTDTVSARPLEAWTRSPFGANIENGRLYGRGAIDCKGGIVAGMAAVLSAKDEDLRRPITLVCVPDEESGATGELGIKELARQNKLNGLGAIYAYPNMNKLILGHRGVYRFTLEIETAGGHTGSRKWQDSNRTTNALTAATDFTSEFVELGEEFRETNGDGLFRDYQTVVTPAVLTAGVSAGLVPSSASLTVDVRLLPGTDLEALKQQFWERIVAVFNRLDGQMRFRIRNESYIPATEIAADESIVRAVSHAALRETGIRPKLAVSGPANESYLLNGMGIPTVILGPIGENAHAADEWVDLDSVATAARIYRRAHRLVSRIK